MLPDIIQVKTIVSQFVLGSANTFAKLTGLNLMPLFGFHFRFSAPRITSSEGEAGKDLSVLSLWKNKQSGLKSDFLSSAALNSGDSFRSFVPAMFDQPCKLR